MQEKILIMGGSYFIGRKIVDQFLKQGKEIYVLNRGTSPLNIENVIEIICDREDPIKMKKVLKPYSFDGIIDVSATNKDHLEILLNAIDQDHLKKFIFISSSAVYDVENLTVPYAETDPLNTNHYWQDYGTNKILAEAYLKTQLPTTSTIILRPPYVYGENNYAQRESFIINHLIHHQPIIVPNKGETKLQFIYSGDLAKICFDLYEQETPPFVIYNVGNKEAVSIKEWIETIAKVVNKEAVIKEFDYQNTEFAVRDFFPFHDYDNILNCSLNFVETPFEEGIQKAYEWYQKTPISFKKNIKENEKNILDKYFLGNNKTTA